LIRPLGAGVAGRTGRGRPSGRAGARGGAGAWPGPWPRRAGGGRGASG